ncbi:hypothetical protein DFH09DRAFT_1269746 [Mycena vulgaris]|nr:hypothetical protein DFH09DRAFT_1269746 [Mycena vulgaris]
MLGKLGGTDLESPCAENEFVSAHETPKSLKSQGRWLGFHKFCRWRAVTSDKLKPRGRWQAFDKSWRRCKIEEQNALLVGGLKRLGERDYELFVVWKSWKTKGNDTYYLRGRLDESDTSVSSLSQQRWWLNLSQAIANRPVHWVACWLGLAAFDSVSLCTLAGGPGLQSRCVFGGAGLLGGGDTSRCSFAAAVPARFLLLLSQLGFLGLAIVRLSGLNCGNAFFRWALGDDNPPSGPSRHCHNYAGVSRAATGVGPSMTKLLEESIESEILAPAGTASDQKKSIA